MSRLRVGMLSLAMVFCMTLGFVSTPALGEDVWRSSLYPVDWTPGMQDSAGRFLHDFSYAGYHRGERVIPDDEAGMVVDVTDAPYDADPSGTVSATMAIQRAINDVGRNGGGVVYIPEGTYYLTFPVAGADAALVIAWSHVVLQGAGPDKTFLFLDEIETSRKAMVRIGPRSGMDWYKAEADSEQRIREDILEPTMTIALAERPQFSIGDWVALTHDTTEAWVREHNMIGLWPPGTVKGQLFFRQVQDVDFDNNTITLDAPTRYFLKIRDRARVHKVVEPLQEIGLQGFSFGMRENPKRHGWGNNDHAMPGTGASDVHGSRGIVLRGVVNSWVRDVATYRPETNEYAHIHSIGLEIVHSRNVTVQRVIIQNPQYLGGGGNGYPFVIGGQDSLFHSVQGINGRHPITITGAHTNGNVVLGGYIKSPNSLASDFHAFLSVANLIDNLTLEQERFEAGDRTHASGTGGLSHGLSTSQSVFWNIEGLQYKPDNARGDVIVWSEQYGWGYVIGTRGPAFRIGLGTGIRNRPVDFIEGEGKGGTLEPQSLYIDQLRRRLMRDGKEVLWETIESELWL